MDEFDVIGLMSGTSLDGVDVAACRFGLREGKWRYRILSARTFPYSEEWTRILAGLHQADAFTYASVNAEYGHYLGKLTKSFILDIGFRPLLIASHGHTVFHRPDLGFTAQVGSGPAIAAETGVPVVFDFRSMDVALGGQGAPLVPVGDRLLFGEFDACLNLGGFANISLESGRDRIAYDVCPVNFVLNKLARSMGLPYDPDGELAGNGGLEPALLDQLNRIAYYAEPFPKSLGREWVERNVHPLLEASGMDIPGQMRTFCEHVAIQVNRTVGPDTPLRILVTGGGARNRFLMNRIRSVGPHTWHIPEQDLVDFKEALVFALLGLLRYRKEINVWHSVTGSRADHCGGCLV